ncbi:MAG: leucine-rich repeat protein [Butyricicoccus sp.]|nr:leucine-rich repeat protein [Butyricicoccus sp.]
MLRKIFGCILTLLLCVGAVSVTASAADSDFVIENGVLTEYKGNGGAVTIPSGVIQIGESVFYACDSLTSVTMPDSVTSIGNGAFASCKSLTSVTMPDSVTTMGSAVFSNCYNLTSVTMSNSVTTIGNSVFSDCRSLPAITIPNSITSIPEATFAGCDSLTSITIPGGVTSIGDSAFKACENLLSVDIPDSVTTIGDNVFRECTNLKSVVIPNGVTCINMNTFADCVNLEFVSIPSSVTSIANSSFYNCDSLTSVTIPNGVTYIGPWVFAECTNLVSVSIPNSVTSIGPKAFSDCDSLRSVTIPSSVTDFGYQVFNNCDNLTEVTFACANIKPTYVFPACPNLKRVTFYGDVSEDTNFVTALQFWGANGPVTVCAKAGSRAEQKAKAAGIPFVPLTDIPAPTPLAYASTQNVEIDGKYVSFQMYALRDTNGNDTNYIKVRDLASVLNSTPAKFDVSWDGAVNLISGKAYQATGDEMRTPFSGNRTYTVPQSLTRVNGTPTALDAIVLTDDAGGDYTYYKLRDLGNALGFHVDWSAERGVFIQTN